jgi:hypothetical protein
MLTAGQAQQPTTLDSQEAALWQEGSTIAGPNLELSEPQDAVTVKPGAAIEVKGTSEPGAQVTVNTQPVELKLKGMFTTEITAPNTPGDFQVTVEAKDARNYVTTKTMTVKVTQ